MFGLRVHDGTTRRKTNGETTRDGGNGGGCPEESSLQPLRTFPTWQESLMTPTIFSDLPAYPITEARQQLPASRFHIGRLIVHQQHP